ncbi:13115_t:CDS:2, partial [Racocetra fulgida]
SDLKYSNEACSAYDDIYNALETLNKTDLTKFNDNDPLRIEVIDISSEWARSYLKNDTIDFLKKIIIVVAHNLRTAKKYNNAKIEERNRHVNDKKEKKSKRNVN